MARQEEDQNLEKFGLDVLTLAVLAILITAPIGALGIGLAGPRLLDRQVKGQNTFLTAPSLHRGLRSQLSVCLSRTSDLPKMYFCCTAAVSRRKLAAFPALRVSVCLFGESVAVPFVSCHDVTSQQKSQRAEPQPLAAMGLVERERRPWRASSDEPMGAALWTSSVVM